ncbi:hypothetical protein KC19_5G154000 [Ceratodon purpureus]|uniref:Uncharacterized protein n=1 Tax=Ceratodon purpureus TaxID=3225 RepID=A0A8T0I2Q8_CERPU|nr:hypothetical protein KC19_5G154000 [Ceratodon purpureus]
MMSSQRRNKSRSSSQIDFLNLCKTIVEDLARGGILLNKEQCKDLASKLSSIAQNIKELVPSPEGSSPLFRPALEDLYRYFEKAKVLVSKCRDEDWCAAAVFQSQNENAFRDILLDVGLCYNAIYEQAKRKSGDRIDLPHDLRQSPEFDPAPGSKVDADQADLLESLNDLANEYTDIQVWDKLIARKAAKMKSLANYLLVKMDYTSKELQVDNLDSYSAMLWTKASQPYGTWAKSRFLGAGNGATGVYRTKWLGVPCAKKEFHGQDSDPFFLKEAGILAHLKHPCIVNLICCGNGLTKGDRFIAMELMEKSLFHLIEEQKEQKGVPFSLPVAVDMMVQIARGVCYLHDRGVAHRDLKPQNVVVSRLTSPHLSEDYFSVKLVDFGISKTKVEVSKSNTMTAGGLGTTRYRAPEVFPEAYRSGTGKATWLKADVYSFAMTCAHLLSLKSPFEEMQNPGALYEKLGKGERPELPVGCPKELVGLLKKCWSIRPGSRPSFMQICVELEKLRHAFLSGYGGAREGVQDNIVDMSAGFDFIEGKVDKQSALHAPLLDSIVEEEEGLLDDGELPILACTAGHALEFLPQVPSSSEGRYCNLCIEDIVDEHYQCRACDFDAHSHCSRLEIEVNVFFHKHPLQLLIRSYYNGDPDAVCSFCEESLQHSEWVYRCEQCDFDVHAHCTKHLEEIMREYYHQHPLTLIQCPPGKCLTCAWCNGEVRGNSWRYTCTERPCILDAHPSCVVNSFGPLCVFDKGHRLSIISEKGGFYCGRCGGFGYSWYYHCNSCDVNIHLDCAYDMEEEENWIEVYEQFKAQYMTMGDLSQISVDTISRLLDELRVSDSLGGSSLSASGPRPVVEGSTTRVQPTIRRLASCDTPDLDAIDFDDADLRKKIVAETAERKAKRMRAKAGRLELKAKYLEMLGDLESTIVDLQSSERVLLGDGAEALEKVRKWKDVMEDEMATLVQTTVRQFCRTGVFYLNRLKKRGVLELLTSLRADMVDVRLNFLCEEPGHEHWVEGSFCRIFYGALGEEREGILQPLLARGLEVVAKAMSASLGELSALDSVTLPILRSGWRWDLGAIDVEKHGKVSQNKENVEELKRGEDLVAEWLLRDSENRGDNIFKTYGLLRIRYKVTEECDIPRYTRGSVAWLCKDHVNRGLKDGILESYPLKYYNPELN